MDQRELINRCQLGDLVSFEELYGLYSKKALGMAYIIGGSRNMAEDIVQETFITCYNHINRLKNPEVFNIWFYRILVRVGWRMANKQKAHIPLENSETENISSDGDFNVDESHIDIINNRLLIREAIKKLTPPLKNVVILYYFNELTVREISKILDCFQGTVKSRLHTARKQLEKELRCAFTSEFHTRGKELKLNEE